MENRILVSVSLITYNQEQFIEEAIIGILKQKVNFKFELIIGDDHSTDNTKQILYKYKKENPDIVKLILHANRGNGTPGKINFLSTFHCAKGKYIALCDGDDYWTDNQKLQKQVDFLEANPKYSICWTKYKILYQKYIDTGILNDPDWLHLIKNESTFDITLHNIFKPYSTYAATALMIKDKVNLPLYAKMKYSKDDVVYCMCLSQGQGAILNFFGSVYRVHDSSIYSSTSIIKKFYSNFRTLEEIIKKIKDCNTPNIKKVRNTMLLEAFDISVKDNYSIFTSIHLYYKIILYCKISEKINASRKISKGFLAKISRRLQ